MSRDHQQDRFSGCIGAMLAGLGILAAVFFVMIALFLSYDGYGSDARRLLVYGVLALAVAIGLAVYAVRQLRPSRRAPLDE